MTSNYVIWKYKSVDGACALDDLRGLEKTFRLNNGTPLAAGFSDRVAFHMNENYKTDTLLIDNLLNTDRVIVASKRLQDFVRSYFPPEVEYLPVKIVNHKGRVASKEYAIVHPINPVDCVDQKKSVFEFDTIKPTNFDSFEKLRLDETKIPKDRLLFRIRGFSRLTLVRRDLATAIEAHGFSGIGWSEIEDYPRT